MSIFKKIEARKLIHIDVNKSLHILKQVFFNFKLGKLCLNTLFYYLFLIYFYCFNDANIIFCFRQ